MARRKRSLMRRLWLHGGLVIDAMVHAMCDTSGPRQRVFVDGNGIYGWTGVRPIQDQGHALGNDDLSNRVMRLEAENVYQRERIGRLEAERDRRKRYHKFNVARSWGRCG